MNARKHPAIAIVLVALLTPFGNALEAADPLPKKNLPNRTTASRLAETVRKLQDQQRELARLSEQLRLQRQLFLTNRIVLPTVTVSPPSTISYPTFRNPNPTAYYDQRDAEMKRLFPHLSPAQRRNAKFDLMFPTKPPQRAQVATQPLNPDPLPGLPIDNQFYEALRRSIANQYLRSSEKKRERKPN